MRDFRYLENVVTLEYDEDRCVGCGACVDVCPHGVLEMGPKVGRSGRMRVVDRDGCMECGACMVNCPTKAVSVQPGVGCASYILSVWLVRLGIRKTPSCC